MSAKKAVPHEAISQHIDRIERLGYQPFRDAAQKLGVDASGGNSEIRSRISAHVQAKGLRSLDRVATGAERASRATAKAELTKLMSLTGASSRARAQAVAAGLAPPRPRYTHDELVAALGEVMRERLGEDASAAIFTEAKGRLRADLERKAAE